MASTLTQNTYTSEAGLCSDSRFSVRTTPAAVTLANGFRTSFGGRQHFVHSSLAAVAIRSPS